MYRNEAMPLASSSDFPRLSRSRKNNYSLKDQLQGSLTLNVMNKLPFAADEIANEVFINITGFREWFKEKGIHKFTGLGVSKESLVRISSNGVEVTNVSIQISFTREEQVFLAERLFNTRLYRDGEEMFEGIDFVISADGTQIILKNGDSTSIYTIDYVDAITLEEKTNIDLISDSENNTLYTVSGNGSIYGYYNLFEAFKASKDEEEWIEQNQQT